jgi:hypothetical protein
VEPITGLHSRNRLLYLPEILEVTGSDKHSSLIRYGIYYGHKISYNTNQFLFFCYNLCVEASPDTTVVNATKLFTAVSYDFPNKLERWTLTSLSSLVYCLPGTCLSGGFLG